MHVKILAKQGLIKKRGSHLVVVGGDCTVATFLQVVQKLA